MPTDWNDMEERLLINERRTRNVKYHALKNGRPNVHFGIVWRRELIINMEQHLLVTNVTTSS
jgi:hypothetical protein